MERLQIIIKKYIGCGMKKEKSINILPHKDTVMIDKFCWILFRLDLLDEIAEEYAEELLGK